MSQAHPLDAAPSGPSWRRLQGGIWRRDPTCIRTVRQGTGGCQSYGVGRKRRANAPSGLHRPPQVTRLRRHSTLNFASTRWCMSSVVFLRTKRRIEVHRSRKSCWISRISRCVCSTDVRLNAVYPITTAAEFDPSLYGTETSVLRHLLRNGFSPYPAP